jgi:hypothetical protein
MASETTTPNIGLQVPAYNQANWNVPIQYDLNLLDLIFGGQVEVPALKVGTLNITGIAALLAPSFVAETPTGVVPGNAYTLSFPPVILIGVFVNGVFQRPALDYTLVGKLITLVNATTVVADNVFAVYLK